jgi:hypothetical protein
MLIVELGSIRLPTTHLVVVGWLDQERACWVVFSFLQFSPEPKSVMDGARLWAASPLADL